MVSVGRVARGQPRRQALEAAAHVDDVEEAELRERHVHAQEPVERLRRHGRDDGAAGRTGSDARVDDPDGMQGAHALTHHGTADGELRGEVTLGGQHVADTQTARDDAVLDPLHDTLVGTPRS